MLSMLSRGRRRSVTLRRLVVIIAAALLGGVGPGTARAAEPGRLGGVVRDQYDAKAIGKAAVKLVDAISGAVAAQTTTTASGAYSFAVPAGTYTMDIAGVSGDRRYVARIRGVTVGSDTALNVSVVRPVFFRGTVRDGNGEPVPGVMVSAAKAGNLYYGAGATLTMPDGTFALGVPAGRYDISISTDYGAGAGLRATAWDIDVSEDRTEDLTFPIGETRVVVQDAGGRPIAGAQARLWTGPDCWVDCSVDFTVLPGARTTTGWATTAVTDADGKATLPVLPGDDLTFTATAAGEPAGVGRVRRTAVSVPTALPLRAVLGPTVTLRGTLTDVNGRAVYGSVTLENDEYESGALPSSEDGTFAVEAPPGRYRLHVAADLETAWVKLGMESGATTEGAFVTVPNFDLTADRVQNLRLPTGQLTVHVVDADGQPVPAVVEACSGGASAACDVEGLDTKGSAPVDLFPGGRGTGLLRNNVGNPFKVFPDGATTVKVTAGYATKTVTVEPGTDVATIGMPAMAPISGTVGDARGPFEPFGPSGDTWVAMDPDRDNGWGAPLLNGSYSLSAAHGHRVFTVMDVEGHDELDEATATLPAFWSIQADYDVTGPATIDVTVPDAAPADVMFVDWNGVPRIGDLALSGSTLAADIPLGNGLVGRGWIGTDTVAPENGWYRLQLFGPSQLSGHYWSSDSTPVDVRLRPGERLVVAEAMRVPSANPGPLSNLRTYSGSDSISLSWNPPLDSGGGMITGYTVTATGGTPPRTTTVKSSGASATVTGLTPDTVYEISVTAENLRGSGPALTASVTTGPPSPTTTTPTNEAPNGDNPPSEPGATTATQPAPRPTGYWALSSKGTVYNFGAAEQLGNSRAGAVDLEATPSGKGYWILNANGSVQPFGDAAHLGDLATLQKDEVPASLSATPTGKGYWIFTNRGRAIAFGDAPFLGDMSATKLNGPVLGSVATPSGRGYYMVASDGGIFAFGDATFAGSMGDRKLNAPVQSLVPDADGRGYWLVASDGGIFAFDAPFKGSLGSTRLNKPVVGMVCYGDGYLMVGADGGIFNFSSLPFAGSLGDRPPASLVVAVAALP